MYVSVLVPQLLAYVPAVLHVLYLAPAPTVVVVVAATTDDSFAEGGLHRRVSPTEERAAKPNNPRDARRTLSNESASKGKRASEETNYKSKR